MDSKAFTYNAHTPEGYTTLLNVCVIDYIICHINL